MSRRLRLGTISLGKFRTDIREIIQIFDQKTLTDGLLNTHINDAIQFLYEVLGWKNQSAYRDTVVIPIIKSVYSNHVVGSGWVSALSQLTVPATADWVNDTGFNSDWVGATGTLYNTNTSTNYNVTVTQIVNSTQVILQSSSGVIPNIVAANLIVNLSLAGNLENDNVDLSLIPNYKQINKIEKIMSTFGLRSTTSPILHIGGEDEYGNVKIDSNKFDSIDMRYNYADSIIWYIQGEILKEKKGANVTSYGTRTLYYVTVPALLTDDSDLIDVRDTDISLVRKYVVVIAISGLPKEFVKVSIPETWVAWVNDLQGLKQGAVEKKPTNT